MAKISNREKVLLGYSPNYLSNSPSRRSSEVDFSDVFGGPPRCSSTQEFYSNETEDVDCVDVDDDDVELAGGIRTSWFGFREKPAFGDEAGVQRRYPSEDFFDDIFRGDQPLLSDSPSPRVNMPGRNPFYSAPGSRAMSPSRPLPPITTEPFAGPAKFSLPGQMTSTDLLSSTSVNQRSNSSGPSLSRFSETIKNHDALLGDARSTYRPSALSHQVSVARKELTSSSKLDGDGPEIVDDSKGSEFPNGIAQFHFSIYKWANKGVPVLMSFRKRSPSRSKKRNKLERCLSASERVGSDILVTENDIAGITDANSLFSNKSGMPSTSQVNDHEHCNNTIVYSKSAECRYKDDIGAAVFKSTCYESLQNIEDKAGKATCSGIEDVREESLVSRKNLGAVVGDDPLKFPLNMKKSNLSPQCSLFDEEKKDTKAVIAENGGKGSMVLEKEKPSLSDVLNHKVNQSRVHESFREAKDDFRKSEVTGKVKEFVKIFNQESSSKSTSNIVGQSHSWRWKDTTTCAAENGVKSFSTPIHDEMQASYVDWEKTWPEASQLVDGKSFQSGEQQYNTNSSVSASDIATPALTNESIANHVRASVPNINATSDDGMVRKEMLRDENIQLKIESQEDIQGYEVKVSQWSKGKEANIRALLSTLQCVLWPNSGWKPIPLVDIIEANAVKRAYQKALLCLHPDKLQQKGAAPHQKFIAEKVFDILQEAWDRFNSLGPL